MGKKSGPSTPDYKGAAEADAQSSKEVTEQQTWANRPDQYTPWGSVQWENQQVYDPATKQNINRWTQNEMLTPQAQAAFDAQLGLQKGRSELGGSMMDRVGQEVGQEIDWAQFGGQQGLDFDPSQLRQRAEDNAYAQSTSRLAPQFQGAREQAEIKLRNQGLRSGDQAYEAEMGRIGQQETDAYGQAQMSAMGVGRQEQGQLFGQQKEMANYSNQLRQNAMADEMRQRGFSLNEMNALLTGQQVQNPSFEGFQGANRSAGMDNMGAAQNQYGADLNSYNAGQAGMQGLMSGAGALGGAAMMCDRRLKRGIKLIGEIMGYPLYSFEYLWGEKGIGPMADEVNPEAVIDLPNGYQGVDVNKLEAA